LKPPSPRPLYSIPARRLETVPPVCTVPCHRSFETVNPLTPARILYSIGKTKLGVQPPLHPLHNA
jgi:hypothetical protein